MCHTSILQCWYDCCQKYDMAYKAERWQLIWRAVDLHPLRGEFESIILSFTKMKKKIKNIHNILCLHIKILSGFLQQSIYEGFCSLVGSVILTENSPEHRLRLLNLPKGKSPGELPLGMFPMSSANGWRPDPTEITGFIMAKISSLVSAIKQLGFLIPFLFLAGSKFPKFPGPYRFFRLGCKL